MRHSVLLGCIFIGVGAVMLAVFGHGLHGVGRNVTDATNGFLIGLSATLLVGMLSGRRSGRLWRIRAWMWVRRFFQRR